MVGREWPISWRSKLYSSSDMTSHVPSLSNPLYSSAYAASQRVRSLSERRLCLVRVGGFKTSRPFAETCLATMLLRVRRFLELMHFLMLCHPGNSFLFVIKDCAVAMKSGRGMCCFSLRPGVNDHSFVVGSWRIIPWRGLDITDGR